MRANFFGDIYLDGIDWRGFRFAPVTLLAGSAGIYQAAQELHGRLTGQ